jgi:hypothetical protein
MPERLDNVEQELRSAVLAADHVLAGRLASEYAKAVAEVWKNLAQPERATSAVPAQSSELLRWARGMAIVQRAILAEQLAALEKTMRYTADQAPKRPGAVQVSL